jgi:hypothetical protein
MPYTSYIGVTPWASALSARMLTNEPSVFQSGQPPSPGRPTRYA